MSEKIIPLPLCNCKDRKPMFKKGDFYYCSNKRSGCGFWIQRSTWEELHKKGLA